MSGAIGLAEVCLCRVRALGFRAGGMVLLIPWRGGAERRAGFGPRFWPAAPALLV
jgi:hypothetical protein